jgi:hypothetical protein
MSSLLNVSTFAETILASENRFDAEWSYDPISGRYRGTNGRFLSQKAIEALIDGRVMKLDKQLKDFTKRLIDGSITIDQWQGSVREALKPAHIQATMVGVGGKTALSQADYGRIGQKLRSEYAYLQKFAAGLLADSVSAPMALARIGLYAESVRASFWEGTAIRQGRQGYSLMQRILDSQAAHCDDCLSYSARGIVPIGSLPMPGQRCACRARCRCSVRYLRQQAPVVSV